MKAKALAILALGCCMLAACGTNKTEETTTAVTSAAETASETKAAEETEAAGTAAAESTEAETNAEAGETAEAPKEEAAAFEISELDGNYIDDKENHLGLHYMTVENGKETDGWVAIAVIDDKLMTAGELQEENRTLTGVFTEFTQEGTDGAVMNVTITKEDGNVVLRSDDGREFVFAPDDTDYAAEGGEMLPFFQYNQLYAYHGFNNLDAAVYDYLSFEKESASDPNNVMIPYAKIVAVDDTDPEDVLIYGDYWLWEFQKQEDTLAAVSGGHCPGIIHAERFGDPGDGIYSAVSMEEAFTDDDTEKLFGEHYEAYVKIASDDQAREAGLAQVIADYASANDLEVNRYELPGEWAVRLPESNAGKPHQKVDLPPFTGSDPSSEEAAVWRYLISAYSETLDADTRDVTIPYAVFLAKDESDPEDIRLLFFGEVMCYNLEDNILEMVSSTESSGAAHLKKTGDGFEVTSFDSVWDGTDYEKTAREIFGEHYEEFINLDDETKQAARKQNIRDYVKKNGLEVTAYMDFDGEPVNLD